LKSGLVNQPLIRIGAAGSPTLRTFKEGARTRDEVLANLKPKVKYKREPSEARPKVAGGALFAGKGLGLSLPFSCIFTDE
jgi:hypothetical protein